MTPPEVGDTVRIFGVLDRFDLVHSGQVRIYPVVRLLARRLGRDPVAVRVSSVDPADLSDPCPYAPAHCVLTCQRCDVRNAMGLR